MSPGQHLPVLPYPHLPSPGSWMLEASRQLPLRLLFHNCRSFLGHLWTVCLGPVPYRDQPKALMLFVLLEFSHCGFQQDFPFGFALSRHTRNPSAATERLEYSVNLSRG